MKSNLLLSILLLFLISCNKNDEVSEKDSLSIYCCGTKNPQWLLDEMNVFYSTNWTEPAPTMGIYSLETDSVDYIALVLTAKKENPTPLPFFYTCDGNGKRIGMDTYDTQLYYYLRKLLYDNKFKLLWETQLEAKQ